MRDEQNEDAFEELPRETRPAPPRAYHPRVEAWDQARPDKAGRAPEPHRTAGPRDAASDGYEPKRPAAGTPRPQPDSVRRAAPSPRRKMPKTGPLFSIFFFPAAVLYEELLLRAFDRQFTPFWDVALLRILLFSLAAGLVTFVLLDIIPKKGISRLVGALLLFFTIVITCVERGVRLFFSIYFGLTTIFSVGGEVAGDFQAETLDTIVRILPFILLSLLPLALFCLMRRRIVYKRGCSWAIRLTVLAAAVLFQLGGWGLSAFGAAKPAYTYEFSVTNAIPDFGLLTTVRLELQYAVFGTPEEDMSGYIEDDTTPPDTNPPDSTPPDTGGDTSTGTGDTTEDTAPPQPVEYGYNVLENLDFDALAASASSKTLKQMHEYFGSLTPSRQNEYTGLFKGKNLIFITAESFSTAVMSPELTPTLWKLSHEGFVFNDYYQPDWTMSTAGGEFANLTGVIPNWVSGKYTIYAVIGNQMPLTLGHLFNNAGYNVNAYHNHKYKFYRRNEYLKDFGYDYYTFDGGVNGQKLDWPQDEIDQFPKSDLTLMQVTADKYIDEYLKTGTPFHTYYMSVSAHSVWTWANNDMSRKNRAAAEAAYPNASPVVQAYIAANLELEAGMKYLVEKLESAGIADDTLIVLSTDHYPYRMLTEDYDYFNELRGVKDTETDISRYKTTLIMWSPSIQEPVTVDTPCYSCDLVPTLANLFGLPYDSRLYSGRDIFATNYEPDKYSSCMPLVIFADNHGQGNSWITAAGSYDAVTGKFTANEGITVDEDYVSSVKKLVSGKIKYAKLIISEDYYKALFS